MTLSNRLSLFFLGALALVLIGFSSAIYWLVHTHLHRQAAQRLEAAINTLSADVDTGPRGLQWEPEQRHFDHRNLDGSLIVWQVTDGHGRWIDGSQHADSPLAAFSPEPGAAIIRWQDDAWRLSERRLDSPSSPAPTSKSAKAAVGRERSRFPTLVIRAAVSLRSLEATLRQLALALIGVSAAIWATAALVGRWLCRRGLAPLTRMAATARAMDGVDLGRRLPIAKTQDELQDLGLAFNDLLARLQESFARQRRFTGDASHQLRTPLAAMLGQIEVALRRDRAAEEYRDVLGRVHDQAQQLRHMVESLLFLARADAEAALPNLEEVDLDAWLTGHLQKWSTQPRFADLHKQSVNGTPLVARVHLALLGQLLDNLLENACKASEPGTPIRIRLNHGAGRIFITVADGGCGIGAEDLPHVFEPFYRARPAQQRDRTGVGLGLAVVQRIAAALGGGIHVQSELGRGSEFTLWLPVSARH